MSSSEGGRRPVARRPPVVSTAAQQFGRVLRAKRESRGLTLRQLGAEVFADRTRISRIETGQAIPTLAFAEACDRVLATEGVLIALAEAARAEPYFSLPPAPAFFIGREEQIGRLDELAASQPETVIFVDGQPGVGKTALALHWAHAARARYDGVLWADLRGYAAGSPAKSTEVLRDLLRGLGVRPERIPAEEHMRASLFRGLLQGQRLLILLDNASDSKQVRPVLPGMPGCTVLVTSRQRLQGLVVDPGAVPVSLTPLAEADAAELLAGLIGPGRVRDEPRQVEQLVRLCAALPLAVRIAGERIAAHPEQSIAELTEELQAEGRRLELLAAGDDDTIGIRSAYSWSYRALGERPARLFRLLGLHRGPHFSSGAAAAVAGFAPGETRRLLDELVQAHLVRQLNRDGYAFHDLIRVYAADEAAGEQWRAEREAAVFRLTQWYLRGINGACKVLTPARDHHPDLGPSPEAVEPPEFAGFEEAYRWCSSELANVTGAAQLALDHRLYEVAWRIPVELFDFHLLGRPWEVWISSHDVAMEAARAGGDKGGLAWVATNLAEAHRRRHDLELAHSLYSLAVDIAEEVGPSQSLVWALVGLGNISHELGDYPEAARLIEQAVSAAVEVGYVLGEATARVHLGRAHRDLGNRDLALEHGRRALAVYSSTSDQHGMGFALGPLARTSRRFGDYEQALEYADAALEAYTRCGDIWGQADAFDERGCALSLLGRSDEAVKCWNTAVDLVGDLDERKAEAIRGRLPHAQAALLYKSASGDVSVGRCLRTDG